MSQPQPEEYRDEAMQERIPSEALPDEKETMSSKKRFTLGVFFMLLSGLGFAAQGLFVNLAADVPAPQKTFFRNVLVLFVAFAVMMYRTKGRHLIRRKVDYGWLLLRSVLGTAGILANFYALARMPIANAQLLNKLSPFFTIIFSALFMKERVNKIQLAGILTAFVGVVVLTLPDVRSFEAAHVVPILVALAGGLLAGAAYTTVHYLTSHGVHGSFIIFFFATFSSVAMIPFLIADFKPMSGREWLYMLLIGLSAMVGQYGITYAYHFAEPRRISIFDYSSVVFAMLLGMAVLDQMPSGAAIVGNLIIFLAFLMMFIYNRRSAEKRVSK